MARQKKKAAAEPERLSVPKTYKLYVNGGFPRSESGRYVACEDAKGKFFANYARGSRKDLRDAVGAARKAFGPWGKRSAFNRSQILFRLAEMVEDRRSVFEDGLRKLAGFSAAAARRDVSVGIDRLFWYAGWADKFAPVLGGINPVASPFFNFTIPEPTGVVVVFAPENSPFLGLASSIAPVILSGNTVVAVVDNMAPTIAVDLAEAMATSDLPGGVVNILTGYRDELLPHAASHMDVNAIAFHGGTKLGIKALQEAAADNVKRVKLLDDPPPEDWRDPAAQSLYRILPFVEMKTAWHPIGL